MVVNKGFSLIELLVAMAIMSMTLLISSLGYSFFMERWQGNLGRFDQSANTAKKLILANRVITGVYPYVLRDDKAQPVIYFEGSEDGFVAVSTRSLFNDHLPCVVRFSIAQQEDFSYRLLYEESVIDQVPLSSVTQNISFSTPLTLFTELSDIKFSYFGYENDNSRVNNAAMTWWQTFNSLQRKVLPERIKISFVLDGKQESFDFIVSQVDPRILVLFHEQF